MSHPADPVGEKGREGTESQRGFLPDDLQVTRCLVVFYVEIKAS